MGNINTLKIIRTITTNQQVPNFNELGNWILVFISFLTLKMQTPLKFILQSFLDQNIFMPHSAVTISKH